MHRWAILGTGPVSRKFVLGLRALGDEARVTVVASRTKTNAERFAADFDAPHVTDDYAAATRATEADFVYVATPPSEHEAHARLAIAAGKPVLIEKPFAIDLAAARRIVEAARAARVFCMEAMWTRFLPLMEEVRALITSGAIGEIRSFHGSFFGAARPDAAVSLFDPARGGGALMHRGVYPLSIARDLLGPIVDVRAVARMGATGVDEDCALTLTHRSGAVSTLQSSIATGGVNEATVHGSEGTIHMEPPIYRPFVARVTRFEAGGAVATNGHRLEALREGPLAQGLQQRATALVRILRHNGSRRLVRHYRGNGYHYEAEAAMRAAASGHLESAVMPLDESLDVMAAVDEARSQW